MDKIKNVLAYFCLKYPHGSELSKARLTKLVFLADWISALYCDKQITGIQWVFNHYGPYVDDVVQTARFDDNFTITHSQTVFGGQKEIIAFTGNEKNIDLNGLEKGMIDIVIERTQKMYFNEFIDYVYSTYPVRSKKRYSYLDLEQLAQEYKKENKQPEFA